MTNATNSTLKVLTHGGIFHADDVFSIALLGLVNPHLDIKSMTQRVFKVSEEDLQDTNCFVLDIGRKYDPSLNNFDHHQDDSPKLSWDSEDPSCAFSQLWLEYGDSLLNYSSKSWQAIFDNLVRPISLMDNGAIESNPDFFTVSHIISSMNISWKDDPKLGDEKFWQAVELAKGILKREVDFQNDLSDAEAIVMGGEVDGEVLKLSQFCPWQEFIDEHKDVDSLNFVVYESLRGGFNLQCIPPVKGSFDKKKELPFTWKKVKPKGCNFVHPGCFLAAFDSIESAVSAGNSF